MEPNSLWKALIVGLILALFLILSSAVSFSGELDDINAAIKAKGAQWIAGETSMSRLSAEERQRRLGTLLPERGDEGQPYALSPSISRPASLDWRNYNGQNFVTPVKNQGSCGSNWAFPCVGALESYILRRNNAPGLNLDLSEQVLVSCCTLGSYGCSGGSPGGASIFIRDHGLPPESCYPYTATDGNCSAACSNWELNAYKIDSYSNVPWSLEDIKNALFTHGPLVTTMYVYDDFYSYSSGIYSLSPGSNLLGMHAILIVGYDDPGQYFIAKNSWATWWGENGFFRIAYSEVNSDVKFGQYTYAYVRNAAPAPTVFLNEIHYDNIGGAVGSAIEIAGSAGTDLANWSIVLYDGSNGLPYDTISLSGVIPNQQKDFGTLVFYPNGIIQNGAPDGFALVDPSSNVIQFLSYKGSFVANSGQAIGMPSTDIGVFEDSNTPVGYSLQNTGLDALSKWSGPLPDTFGSLNAAQLTPIQQPRTVIFDNFDSDGGFSPTDNVVAAFASCFLLTPPYPVRAAAQFTVAGGDYHLSSITLPISFANVNHTGQTLRVRLTGDSANAPGTTLEVLSANQGIWPNFANPFITTTTLTSTAHPRLARGGKYWIVIELTSYFGTDETNASVDYRWFFNTSKTSVPFRQQLGTAFNTLPTDPWTGFFGNMSVAFRVEGTGRALPFLLLLD